MYMLTRVGFKYIFVFELNITKGCVFHIWSVFEKYLQIQ